MKIGFLADIYSKKKVEKWKHDLTHNSEVPETRYLTSAKDKCDFWSNSL